MTRKNFFIMIILIILQAVLLIGCNPFAETLVPTIEATPTTIPSTPTIEQITSTPDAFIVWSEDFDDGDLDGWETWWQRGFYSVDNGVLIIETGGDLYHESTVLHGTWSFDLYMDDNTGTTHEFRFTEGVFNFQNMEVKQEQETQIWITTQKDGAEPIQTYWDLGEKLSGWHHFDITKDESGLIKVYLDGELLFGHLDARSFDAEKLVVMYCCSGPVLDNLTVWNQVIEIPSGE